MKSTRDHLIGLSLCPMPLRKGAPKIPANLLVKRSLEYSYLKVVLAIIFISLPVAGCGTLKNSRSWGQDAIYPVDLKGIPRAAFNALVDPETIIPVAGALVFAVDGYDRKVSNWATQHHPIFGSEKNARNACDYLSIPLPLEAVVTALATPSGDDTKDWAYSKLKGITVESAAVAATEGVTSLMKNTVNRTRPDGGGASMPSGHSSFAFSVATLSNRNLESIPLSQKVRLPLQVGNILLATSVAWARVEGRNHYPSDVLIGAALGHFLSAFIHNAFLGLSKDERFIVISPLERGAMVRLNFNLQSSAVRQSSVIYRSPMANDRRD
jgi:membrane-associated phospholipid phosphatase